LNLIVYVYTHTHTHKHLINRLCEYREYWWDLWNVKINLKSWTIELNKSLKWLFPGWLGNDFVLDVDNLVLKHKGKLYQKFGRKYKKTHPNLKLNCDIFIFKFKYKYWRLLHLWLNPNLFFTVSHEVDLSFDVVHVTTCMMLKLVEMNMMLMLIQWW
jgi:hypothetical protein